MNGKYKWVLIYHRMATFLTHKPKKVVGGYMDKNGVRYIYKGILLCERQKL